MAYRTPAQTHHQDTAVCCVACGALTSIALVPLRGGSFDCRKCGTNQPVLPEAESPEIADLKLENYGMGKYDELTPLAKEFGKDVQTSGLDFVCDGIPCKIGLNINSGTVMGLDHHAATTGLPQMRFVDERPSHVEAKASGVVKEVQTGDASFDDLIYIESSASDSDVLTVLSAPAIRKAIIRLMRETGAIAIDENGVAFFMAKDASPFDPKGVRERLAWLRVLAGAPRPIVNEPVTVPARVRIAKRIVGWMSPLGLLLFIIGLAKWTPLDARVVFECLGAGIVIALAMLPVWTFLLKGRSTSHREILSWRITTFVFAPITLAGLLVTYNGAFDDSPDRIVQMPIIDVHKDSENETWHATTRDEAGETHSYTFGTQPQAGQIVQVAWRNGALGWTWENGSASVIEAAKR